MIRERDFEILRNILTARWSQLRTSNPWVALSGGADSATVLFSALEAGLKPRCFTFHLEGYQSADLLVSRSMCQAFDLQHEVVVVPRDAEKVRDGARRALMGCANDFIEKPRKILVQVLHPWFHVAAHLGTEFDAVLGIEADSMFLTARHDQELVREKGDAHASKYRRPIAFDPRFSSYHIHRLCREDLGINTSDLFGSAEVAAWFQRFTNVDLHNPFMKWGFVGAYQKYWCRGAWRRDPSSYQVNSGIRDMHAKAFGCEDKSTIAHYNQMAKDLGIVYGSRMSELTYTDEDPIRLILPNGKIAGEPSERDRLVAVGKESPLGLPTDPGRVVDTAGVPGV